MTTSCAIGRKWPRLGAPMDTHYQPYTSNYAKKAKFHYTCAVCGTEMFKDEEISSCEACGCDEVIQVDRKQEPRVSWLFMLAVILAAVAICAFS